MHKIKLSQFGFNLPEELITKYPPENRGDARLLVLHKKTGKIEHKLFKNVIDYFKEDDVFVFNNTRVFPAHLSGYKEKTGADIQVFLLRELSKEQRLWDVLVNPARKIRIGNKLVFGKKEQLIAEVIDNTTSRGRTLRFLHEGAYSEFKRIITKIGETPLPAMIRRKPEPNDVKRYQTIFAKNEGAVAAPTAGMHFSKILLKRFELCGIKTAEVTLHLGLGNFRSIDVEDLTKHKIDSEQIFIEDEPVEIINNAKINKKAICAVGTTVVRTLESSVSVDGFLKPFEGWTNKFVFPPYKFRIQSSMITNFHLPYSIPLISAVAFGGFRLTLKTYEVAIKNGYKFGTYGDAMLIL